MARFLSEHEGAPDSSSAGNVEKVQLAFAAAGIEFTNGDGPGVRLRKGSN
jgi:hypothetical protein